jgi:uncharacterized protein (TIGR02246 family)
VSVAPSGILQVHSGQLEAAQLAEDVEAFLELFAADAVWVTGGGRRLIGADAIRDFTATVLPGWTADGNSARYEVEHVLFIADGVALTAVAQTYLDAQHTVTSTGLPTYVCDELPLTSARTSALLR